MVGRLRGKTEFASGTIRCRRVFLQPLLRRLDLDVRCADGTSIIGEAYVRIDERELREFEREFAADVRNLQASPGPVEEAAEATPRRDTPSQ
jgi:hypothetical protein